jgi:effector-binding domain-containing protein
VDVGFPVASAQLPKGTTDVKAGQTPTGPALKALHRGPYATLRHTYDSIGEHLKRIGAPMPAVSWEVYLNDPQTTAPDDLLTEVFFPIAAG